MAWLDQDKLNREFTKVDKQLDQRLLGQRTLMHDAAPWLDD
jgi:hypothetical protein